MEPPNSPNSETSATKTIRLRSTFPTIHGWKLRTRTAEAVSGGSILAVDDDDWPVHPVSKVARDSLASACDHLGAVADLVDAGQLTPFAQRSLLRSSFLAAAQAAWVLGPSDRSLRIARARNVAIEQYKRHNEWLADAADSPDREASEIEKINEIRSHVAARKTELAAKQSADGNEVALRATNVIRNVAVEQFGPEFESEAMVEWRGASGAAHGFVWQLVNSPDLEKTGETDQHGIATFEIGGSIDALMNPFMFAYRLIGKAWARFDELNGTPDLREPAAQAED